MSTIPIDDENYSPLDRIAGLTAVCRMTYKGDENNKPNDHCYWDRIYPTADSPFGWVENDDHLRKRVRNKFNA